MKKIIILSVLFLFAGTVGKTFAQKNRTLSNGFSINLITGLPSNNYSFPKDADVDSEYRVKVIGGLQIGNRWYFGQSEPFRMGLMVNWLDMTIGFKTTEDVTQTVGDVSICEVGPIGTFALSDDIAIDAYYNLRPTFFAHFFTDDEDSEGYTGAGISNAFGTAFRWKVLNIGLEYEIGRIKCSYIGDADDVEDEKLGFNNLRFMVGVKF